MRYEDLPTLNASLNAISALLITGGFVCIKRRLILAHKLFMSAAVVVSAAFLVSYITYHLGGEETKFQGTGWIRYPYFAMLISHVILAFVIVPLVLRTVYLGVRGRLEGHVKIGPWTMAIWMYVSVTGVLIYLSLYVL